MFYLRDCHADSCCCRTSKKWLRIRFGVKRNFWPVIVFQLFCFSEQRKSL